MSGKLFLGIPDVVSVSALLKPVRSFIAQLGVPNMIHINDLLTAGCNKSEAHKNNIIANEVLTKSGWIV